MLFAAGLGTRLRPLTNDRPKALVEVNGTTLLELNLRRLAAAGFHDIWIHSGPSCDMIVLAAFDSKPDMRITEQIYPHVNFYLDHFEAMED